MPKEAQIASCRAIQAISLYLRGRYLVVAVVLTIAGSDSIGGAGVQADLKAIASLGVHGASVITAVTAQSTKGVRKIIPLKAEDVLEQLEAVLEDAQIDAVKVGMLYSPAVAKAVGGILCDINAPVVVDPVLFAGAGDTLHGKGLFAVLEKDILPTAAIVTPNRYEAEALASMSIVNLKDAEEACHTIMKTGARSVLLKGGHMDLEEVVDMFYEGRDVVELRSPRLPQKCHGGGCTLSSYIAAHLALGMGTRQAVLASKVRIYDAIALSYKVGSGMNIIDPLASLKKQAMACTRAEQVLKAASRLERGLDPAWVPESGTNLAYALPNPQGYAEVCAVEGRLVRAGKNVKRVGDVRFGASRHMADMALALSQVDQNALACMNLRFTPEHMQALREQGLSVGVCTAPLGEAGTTCDRGGAMRAALETGEVPDLLIDEGGPGREAMIQVIGHDPADMLRKISFLLKEDDA